MESSRQSDGAMCKYPPLVMTEIEGAWRVTLRKGHYSYCALLLLLLKKHRTAGERLLASSIQNSILLLGAVPKNLPLKFASELTADSVLPLLCFILPFSEAISLREFGL